MSVLERWITKHARDEIDTEIPAAPVVSIRTGEGRDGDLEKRVENLERRVEKIEDEIGLEVEAEERLALEEGNAHGGT